MAKVTATVYNTVDPYQWVTDIAHQAWKARDIESVAEILELEHQVNQNETLKKIHLIDMVVVAKKNE